MIKLIILLGPAVLASLYFCKLQNSTKKATEIIAFTAVFAFLINSFVIGISFLRGHSLASIDTLFINVGNVTKYCVMAFIASVTLPNILNFFSHLLISLRQHTRRKKRHEFPHE